MQLCNPKLSAFSQAIGSSAAREGMTDGWAMIMFEKIIAAEFPSARNYLGWLYLRPFLPSEGMQAFAKQVSDHTQSRFNITLSADDVDVPYSVALHEAVMLYAHAATKVLSEGGELHDGRAVTQAVLSTRFEGVGGTIVALTDQGDRIESYEVMNYIMEANGAVGSVPVGVYTMTTGQYTAYRRAVVWPGNTTDVPLDHVSERKSCVKGTVYSEDMLACAPCSAGFFSSQDGSDSCSSCEDQV